MLQTDDIGRIFAILQANYGYRWSQQADAIPVWQKVLHGYNYVQVESAALEAMKKFTDRPPTAGQIRDILGCHKPRVSTYLPPPPSGRMSRADWIKSQAALQEDKTDE